MKPHRCCVVTVTREPDSGQGNRQQQIANRQGQIQLRVRPVPRFVASSHLHESFPHVLVVPQCRATHLEGGPGSGACPIPGAHYGISAGQGQARPLIHISTRGGSGVGRGWQFGSSGCSGDWTYGRSEAGGGTQRCHGRCLCTKMHSAVPPPVIWRRIANSRYLAGCVRMMRSFRAQDRP